MTGNQWGISYSAETTAASVHPRETLQAVKDKLEIIELVGLERLWRDTGAWDSLAGAFTEDATIRTTWFDGNACEFIAQSTGRSRRIGHVSHPIVPTYVRLNGDRALVESRAQIQNRSEIDGIWLDLTQHVRFVSRVRRTPDGWRLASFEGIYEKGTVAPVNPPMTSSRSSGRKLRPRFRAPHTNCGHG